MPESTPTTVLVRDTTLTEDLTLSFMDATLAQNAVDAIIDAAESGVSVQLWKGGESFTFAEPDIIMGPSFGFERIDIEKTFADQQNVEG